MVPLSGLEPETYWLQINKIDISLAFPYYPTVMIHTVNPRFPGLFSLFLVNVTLPPFIQSRYILGTYKYILIFSPFFNDFEDLN